MSAKTILITGATDSLGRGVAEALADQGHTLLLHGRSQERLLAVAGTLDTTVRTYLADLASLKAVRGLTEELLRAEDRIYVLVANAGIGGGGGSTGKASDRVRLCGGGTARSATPYRRIADVGSRPAPGQRPGELAFPMRDGSLPPGDVSDCHSDEVAR